MKTTITFELARKAALNEVEAALRLCRNCTLSQTKLHISLLVSLFSFTKTSTTSR